MNQNERLQPQMKCPYCPKVGRPDQMRFHALRHREVKDAREDLREDLRRLELAEYEAKQ